MANLPADLPEDWTSNQKITPNGTEVGLTPQHGYNYLMKQVNDAQTEINNIGTTIEEALTDVAKEASVQEIITSIGETDDTGGSTVAGTVMAKLNKNLSQNESNSADLELIKQILGSGSQEWQEPGTYSFQVPAGITKLTITACGGGAGGCKPTLDYGTPGNPDDGVGGGGGGAAAVLKQEYIVTPGETISITVGTGGGASTNGTATVIGSLVTLPGGMTGGKVIAECGVQASGGNAGGTGGGAGGYGIMIENESATGQSGFPGVLGLGGTSMPTTKYYGYVGKSAGGGGGSLGNGGNGASSHGSVKESDATNGNRGGGGGGGLILQSRRFLEPGNGGNGYVRIEWGL